MLVCKTIEVAKTLNVRVVRSVSCLILFTKNGGDCSAKATRPSAFSSERNSAIQPARLDLATCS